MISTSSTAVTLVFCALVGRQEPCVDERVQHVLGLLAGAATRIRVVEHGEQLSPFTYGPRPLRGDEVAEHLAHDWDAVCPDFPERVLRVLRERTSDAADFPICLARQQPVPPDRASPTGERQQRRVAAALPAPCSPRRSFPR